MKSNAIRINEKVISILYFNDEHTNVSGYKRLTSAAMAFRKTYKTENPIIAST